MKPFHDWLVGAVAIGFGCLLMLGAIANGRWLMQLNNPRMLVQAVGPATARWVIGVIGVALIAMGVLIASGWRIHWSS